MVKQITDDNGSLYQYVKISTLKEYLEIINTILNQINNKSKNIYIKYFENYHIVMLVKLQKLFETIIKSQANNNYYINVTKADNELTYIFHLFNYFKDILFAYKTSQN